MNIKHYKIKSGITLDDIKKEVKAKHIPHADNGTWVHKDSVYVIWQTVAEDITVNVAFPADLSQWNDFDFILLLDEDFGQPYTPFYSEKMVEFPFLNKVKTNYSRFLESLNFMERDYDNRRY